MFLGRYEHGLDDKNRLAIPARFRAELTPGAVITRGFDPCLCIYPADRWDALAGAIADLPQTRAEARSLARAVFSSAVPCEFDRQGRVSLPLFLREYAGITSDAVVVGLNSHVEIWSRDAWQREQERMDSSGPEIAEILTGTAAHAPV